MTMTEELQALRLRHNVAGGTRWMVGAEDYAKRWTGGRSNLFSLAEANVATTLVCHQVLGSAPIPVHPHTARSQVGVPTAAAAAKLSLTSHEAGSDSGGNNVASAPCAQHPPSDVKGRVLWFVSQHAPVGFEWPLRATARRTAAKYTATETTQEAASTVAAAAAFHPCCYDVADAYVVARYVALQAQNRRLLEQNAALLIERQTAYRASKRYISNLQNVQTQKGRAAAQRYDANVSKRIERKLLADLRAGMAT